MNIFELQPAAWNSLLSRQERLPHALLLIGQKGLGKFQLAWEFAAYLLCESPEKSHKACGKCLACNWFEQGNHPDFRLLQPDALSAEAEIAEEGKKKPSQQIVIEQIRALDEFLGVGSHRNGLSIVLLNPAEAMNKNAANAILKTLEEPRPNTLFLLISSEPSRLLPTIRSRCQSIPVALPSSALASRVLSDAGVQHPERWLALAGGSPRLASELAASSHGAWIDKLIGKLLHGADSDPLIAAGDIDKLLKDSKGRVQLRHVIEACQKWLVDLTLNKNGQPVRYFLEHQSKMKGLTDMIPATRLISLYRTLNRQRLEAEQPLNSRLFLEGVFLEYKALFNR